MNKLDKFLKYYFLVSIIGLSLGLILLHRQIKQITIPPAQKEIKIEKIDICGEECRKQIEEQVAKAMATVSAGKKTTTVTTASTDSTEKTAFIPLSGPISTTSTDWYGAPGTDFYLSLTDDYGKNAQVYWEAFLKVAHANGIAYARLFDVTHGIGVSGSEISITNSSDLKQVSSGKLSIWAGNNLYRVQLKSLNSFEVTFGNGRVKIIY